MRTWSLYICISSILVLASCSSTAPSGNESTAGGTEVLQYELPDTPLSGIRDQFAAAALPDEVTQQAKTQLIMNCMEKARVPFEFGMFDPPLPSVDEIIGNQALGVDDASRGGYPKKDEGGAEKEVPDETRNAYFGNSSSLEGRVEVKDIVGDGASYFSSTGCEAEALKDLYGNVADGNRITGMSLLNELNTVVVNARSSKDYEGIAAQWRECIGKVSELALVEPDDARSAAETLGPTEARNLAIEDAECRELTNFQSQYDKLIDRHLSGFKSTIEPVIVEYLEIKSRALEKARPILGG